MVLWKTDKEYEFEYDACIWKSFLFCDLRVGGWKIPPSYDLINPLLFVDMYFFR